MRTQEEFTAPEDDDFDNRPSKSQLKREMHDLQALGEDMLTLPASRIEPLGLPEILADAIKAAKKIAAHEGRRRQMQYIGKLMRRVDPEPLRQAVADFKLGHAKDSLALHQSEAWRERLLKDDNALQAFIQAHEGVDVQQLRSLLRAARKDAALEPEKRSGRAYRDLFQFIKAEQLRINPSEDKQDEEDSDE
ncbi:ribosome-associated protein [Paucibacter oligotrophus]|uniref:Dual-action ribosomal maturation protein DarP n=1 Tax=Roseateles oligotrophus TaxID=1769250 RepID=A0A840LAX7_9BURK|nr:ribosome biogenesis factor YjgA [Roseateles oligotrophus]MBB4844891.1 ribosome-associated protein [Roseateles oligotrophus]